MVQPQLGVARYRFEIPIRVQHLQIASHRDSGDEAVIERAHGFSGPAATPVEAGGPLEIAEPLNCHELATTEHASQLIGVRLVTTTREHLHHHDIGRVELPLRFQ